jgi:hypothetical protein
MTSTAASRSPATTNASKPDAGTPFVATPRNRLFAIFDGLDDGERAIRALESNGFRDQDDIWVLHGAEGRKRLDFTGGSHGLGARIIRMIQRAMSDEYHRLRAFDAALDAGHLILAVRVPDDDGRTSATAQILRECGAHSLSYYGQWSYSDV